MDESRIEFAVNDVGYAVVRPDAGVLAQGNRVHRRAWQRAISAAAPRRANAESILLASGEWDQAKDAELGRLRAAVAANEQRLQREDVPVAERRTVALATRELRRQMSELGRAWQVLDLTTADAKADNALFNFYAAKCIVFAATGKPVFKDVDDYMEYASEPHAQRGAAHLASLLVPGMSPDWEKNLPENIFLATHGE